LKELSKNFSCISVVARNMPKQVKTHIIFYKVDRTVIQLLEILNYRPIIAPIEALVILKLE